MIPPRAIAVLLAGLCLTACKEDTADLTPTEADIARAETLRPADPALAEIYERSCIACHALPDAHAPLAGHAAAWAPRLKERGADGLLHSALNGYGNMPARGYCADCGPEEFTQLIAFMSAQETSQ